MVSLTQRNQRKARSVWQSRHCQINNQQINRMSEQRSEFKLSAPLPRLRQIKLIPTLLWRWPDFMEWGLLHQKTDELRPTTSFTSTTTPRATLHQCIRLGRSGARHCKNLRPYQHHLHHPTVILQISPSFAHHAHHSKARRMALRMAHRWAPVLQGEFQWWVLLFKRSVNSSDITIEPTGTWSPTCFMWCGTIGRLTQCWASSRTTLTLRSRKLLSSIRPIFTTPHVTIFTLGSLEFKTGQCTF